MSIRTDAAHLAVATVINWESHGEHARLRTEAQQLLDIDLARASNEIQQRFVALPRNTRPVTIGKHSSVASGWCTAEIEETPLHLNDAAHTVDLATVPDLRQEADLLVHPDDGRTEEGIPGGHGAGMLRIPADLTEFSDSPSSLGALYQGGAEPC